MKKKAKYKIKKQEASEVNEPLMVYEKNRITFSTIETQNDVQLKYAMSISPVKRLELMRKLNDYAFKNLKPEKILTGNTKLIFTSYEYIPR